MSARSAVPMRLTQRAAAALLSVDERTLRRWHESDDAPPRRSDGKYDGPELVAWYVEREVAAAAELSPDDAEAGLLAARARKEEALAELRELEVAERQGALITIDDALGPVNRLCTLIRGRLLALPSRIAAVLPMPAVEAVEIIEPIVHEFMAELSEEDEEPEDDAD